MNFNQRLTLLLRRLAAALYDGLLLLALWFSAAFLVVAARGGKPIPALTLWFELLLWGLGFLFCGWFWTHGGQTLGLRAWRLRAITREGGVLSWQRSLLRYALALPSWLSVIGVVWTLIDREGRAWHELGSGSRLSLLPRASRTPGSRHPAYGNFKK